MKKLRITSGDYELAAIELMPWILMAGLIVLGYFLIARPLEQSRAELLSLTTELTTPKFPVYATNIVDRGNDWYEFTMHGDEAKTVYLYHWNPNDISVLHSLERDIFKKIYGPEEPPKIYGPRIPRAELNKEDAELIGPPVDKGPDKDKLPWM